VPEQGILEDGEEQVRRAGLLLAEVDRLSVSTIHSFCRRLLASAPFEAGLHPEFAVDASGEDTAELTRAVAQEGFVASCLPDHPHRDALMTLGEYGLGPADLGDALSRLVDAEVPVGELAVDPFGPEEVSALCTSLRTHVIALLGVLRPAVDAAGLKQKVVRELLDSLEWLGDALIDPPASESRFSSFLDEFNAALPAGRLNRLKNWSRGSFNVGEGKAFADCAEDLRALAFSLVQEIERLESVDPVLYTAARQLLAPMFAELQERRRREGLIAFGGLLSGAAQLLANAPGVLSRVRGEIDQLLVDEFQDTNPVQCQLVELIALCGPAEARPGLFIVGDPKQAIYGWRGADLAAYEEFLERMVAEGGERVSLVVNRRSRQVVLDEVDRVMAPVMRAERGLQPCFESLVAAREDADTAYAGPGAAIEYWVSSCWDSEEGKPSKTTVGQAAEVEATQLAGDLARLHRSGQKLSRVGVLFRSGGDLEVYLRALRGHGVPYVVERDKNYYRRREIIDAISLVRTVLEPSDQVAMLGFFRSPWVGLPDAALIPLWLRGFPRLVLELDGPCPDKLHTIRTQLDETALLLSENENVVGLRSLGAWQESVMDAVLGIAEMRQAFEELPSDRFVEQLRRRFRPEWMEASRYQGGYRLANLSRFFADLTAALGGGTRSVQSSLRLLRTYLVDAQDAEEARPDANLEDAVRILTMHKSKGLDFDHVYLPQLHKASGGNSFLGGLGSRTGAVFRDGAWQIELFGARNLGWAGVLSDRSEVACRERIRLLYVAMTRARDRLVLMGNWLGITGTADDPVRVRSLLALLAWREEGRCDGPQQMIDLDEADACYTDFGGARWLYPAFDTAAVEVLESTDQVPTPPLAQIRQDCERLHELRGEALSHQARPLGGAVSAEAHRAAADQRDGEGDRDNDGKVLLARADSRARLGASVGTAVHFALEHIDLSGDPDSALEAALATLPGCLAPLVPRSSLPSALADASEVLRSSWTGQLGQLLRRLAPAVVARELDFVAPSELVQGAAALHYLTGAIDLVYIDPVTGEFVVADFKTDRVSAGAETAKRVESYRGQLIAYAEALQRAYGLEARPRAELWFLRADELVVVVGEVSDEGSDSVL